jgi:hypothetical protein
MAVWKSVENFNSQIYYQDCDPSDKIKNMRLDEITIKSLELIEEDLNESEKFKRKKILSYGTPKMIFDEYCEKMARKLGPPDKLEKDQSFSNKNQFINNVNERVGKILGEKIVNVIDNALGQVGHIKESNGFLWNFEAGKFDIQEFYLIKVFKNGEALTISPTLIRVSGIKEVKRVLFWGNTSEAGNVSISQQSFTLTIDDLNKIVAKPFVRKW